MLRKWFGETERREQDGPGGEIYREAILLMDRYRDKLLGGKGNASERSLRLAAWVKSVSATFYELEQSVYCSERFAGLVRHSYLDQMNGEEYDDYLRHLYFFENSFVRVFSVLDKLGSFLNDRFSLRTEEVKERFSYYTVIRRMRERHAHPELQKQLFEIKEKFKESMHDLRVMRNHEIHGMNAELLDASGRIRKQTKDKHQQIENLNENERKLREGFQMVCESLQAVFEYCNRHS